MLKPPLPPIAALAESGLLDQSEHRPSDPPLQTALLRYRFCADQAGRLLQWRDQTLFPADSRATFQSFLDAGGDPYPEDDRPFRGSDALKHWGEGMQQQLREVNQAIELAHNATREALHNALVTLGRELGAQMPDQPLYIRIHKAYHKGSQLRIEQLDGLPLHFQPMYDSRDKAPFRDALAKQLSISSAEMGDLICLGYRALESLVLLDADAPHLAPHRRAEAIAILESLGLNTDETRQHYQSLLRNDVLERHDLLLPVDTADMTAPMPDASPAP